jgi:hypothetical protein
VKAADRALIEKSRSAGKGMLKPFPSGGELLDSKAPRSIRFARRSYQEKEMGYKDVAIEDKIIDRYPLV